MKYDYAKNTFAAPQIELLRQIPFLWYSIKEILKGDNMRLFVSLAVVGIMASASLPAMAQQQTPTTSGVGYTTQPTYANPLYNSTSNSYYQAGNGGAPIYNNSPSARPLPLQQMVAGKDAPSYSYGKGQAYNNFADPLANMDITSMSPDQARMVRAQRNARAQQAQADYLASLQGQQPPGGMVTGNSQYAPTAGQTYNQFTQPEQQKPKQRRVVYNEKNNPLVTPPRLFNPDQ